MPFPERLTALARQYGKGCWLWPGSLRSAGYAQVKWQGRPTLAHRVAYELLVGPIPDGLELDHTCNVVRCVNPAHMEPVTHAENRRRSQERRTRCRHGHEYTPANTYHDPNGVRHCRTCRQREWRETNDRLLAERQRARHGQGA